MQSFFYYTKQERRGIFVLFVLLAITIILPRFLPKKQHEIPLEYYEARWQELSTKQQASPKPLPKHEPSIHGNKKKLAYSEAQKDSTPKQRNTPSPTKNTSPKPQPIPKPPLSIDINKASVEEWKTLRGIGDVLSERIIKYRNGLGGFYSVNQIQEVYGLSPEVFLDIKPQLTISGEVNKLNINTASKEELEKHSYIHSSLASQIVNYRTKVHAFESNEDVKKLYLVDDELYKKIIPYIEF